jgi:hypothetical protein
MKRLLIFLLSIGSAAAIAADSTINNLPSITTVPDAYVMPWEFPAIADFHITFQNFTNQVLAGYAGQAYATTAAHDATNGFQWGVLYDSAGAGTTAAHNATNGYPWTNVSFIQASGVTNGYPWTNLTVAQAGAVTNGYQWTNVSFVQVTNWVGANYAPLGSGGGIATNGGTGTNNIFTYPTNVSATFIGTSDVDTIIVTNLYGNFSNLTNNVGNTAVDHTVTNGLSSQAYADSKTNANLAQWATIGTNSPVPINAVSAASATNVVAGGGSTNNAGSGLVFEVGTNAWAVYSNGVLVANCNTNGFLAGAKGLFGGALPGADAVNITGTTKTSAAIVVGASTVLETSYVQSTSLLGNLVRGTAAGNAMTIGSTTCPTITALATNILFSGTLSATNGFNYLGTNPAPTGVTIGITAPDSWVWFTNGGVAFGFPAWKNH